MKLYNLIELSQTDDKDALMEILIRYKPLVNNLSRKLAYEEAETDVTITFIELIKRLDLEKFSINDEGRLVSYITICMNSKNIDLFRKHIKPQIESVEINTDILTNELWDDYIINKICINDIFDTPSLTEIQKNILKEKYIFDKSDIEIAKKLNISRQSVNRTVNRGLQNIKKCFFDKN